MNSKTSYTLCTPPSHKSCEKLPNSVFDSDIAKRLYLAQQKLRPVIDDVMRTTENLTVNYKTNKSHYLTVEQYEDAILASQILKDVDKIISEKQNDLRMKKYNVNKFTLGKENIKVNKSGKIYVDTSILIQLIELHKTLGDIINNTRKAYTEASNKSNGRSSCSQTDISDTSVTYNSYEGRDLSSDEKFNIILMNKNSGKSKQKIRINILNHKSMDTKTKSTESESIENATREVLPLRSCPLSKNIVVMSAHTLQSKKSNDEQKLNNMKKLSTLSEERTSNSETNLTDIEHSPRKIKSTGSIKSDGQKSKVTDVVGARKIILNCLYDLKKVRSFLERVDIAAAVQINTAVLDTTNDTDNVQTTDTEQTRLNVGENVRRQESQPQHEENVEPESHSEAPEPPRKPSVRPKNAIERPIPIEKFQSGHDKKDCCCDATYASDVPMELLLDGGDENASKLIICIKGKTEEEGDVQIIIRQCSECKNLGDNEEISDDQTTDAKTSAAASSKPSDDEHGGFTSESVSLAAQSPIPQHGETPSDVKSKSSKGDLEKRRVSQGEDTTSTKSEQIEKGRPGLNVLFDPKDPSKSIVEPAKAGSHEVQPERSGLNVIFDPTHPSKSIVEPAKKDPSVQLPIKDIPPGQLLTPHSSQRVKKTEEEGDGCSKLKLYETTNLCVSTEDGQELVISLTVRPKAGTIVPKLSLNDIFSESTSKSEHNDQTQEHINQIFGLENDITVGMQNKQQYEHFIPLSRTKICSSLEFDVSVMDTRMRNEGIKHINPGIVVRLKELGVNNLLRACRPVKCGRASVLNEKLRKGIPYSASLTSLPLEPTDGDIIDQSLEMSFNKTKHSSVKSRRNTLTYCTDLGNITNKIKNVQISFVLIPKSKNNFASQKNQLPPVNKFCVKRKLNYYINLVHDIQIQPRNITYQVYVFEMKKYHSARILQKSDTSPSVRKHNRVIDNLVNNVKNPLDKETVPNVPSPNYQLKENLESSPKHEMKCSVTNNLQLKRQNCKDAKKFVSKIPIYKYKKIKTSNVNNENKLTRKKSYIYDVSLLSLPRKDSGGMKDIGVNRNNEYKINTVEKSGNNLSNRNESFNKNWISSCEMTQKTIEKIIYDDQESDCDKMSDDSLELYFNNFFRDKYFSKLALCQKQCSNRSLKPRKKKSEYHYSKSQSQTYISDSTVNLENSSNISNQTQTSEQLTLSHSKNNFKISQSVMFQFTKLFCEYWIKQMLLKQNEENQTVTGVQNFSSSVDIWRNETVQQFFRNVKQKILEENFENTCRFRSQPNVEAGMDNETPSFQYNFTPRPSGDIASQHNNKETLITLKSIEDTLKYRPMFQRDKTNKMIGITNETGNNSCDNFQNVIVTFESNTQINECPTSNSKSSQKRILPSPEPGSSARKGNIKSNSVERAGDSGWNDCDRDTLQYLVYQGYFSSPSMLQRVIEKSRSLFKPNCGNDKRKTTVEYTHEEGVPSLKEKHLDKPPKKCSQCQIIFPVHKLSRLGVNTKELFKDPECKICGCSIAKCQSERADGPCSCKNMPQPKATKETKKDLKPKKSASRKSIGMCCFPKKADISVCVKLESKTQQTSIRQCYCIKCEKRSDDGSCYCSHCLGVFDKSVGKTPSNKEIATQSTYSKANETYIDESEATTIIVPKNEPPTMEEDNNISEEIKTEIKPDLNVEIKPEPDIDQSENNDIKSDSLPPTDTFKPDLTYIKESSDQDEKLQYLKVRTDLYHDDEHEQPVEDLQYEETNTSDSLQEKNSKEENE